MSNQEYLPFGKTDITQEEYREQADLDDAKQKLGQMDVDGAGKKLDRFSANVPEMLEWLEKNGRDFPWRKTVDPWKVLVAEILLQRTRADAVNSVYSDFMESFPDPETLHHAREEEISKRIRSLGFVNRRTRTLKDISRIVMEEHGGEVPMEKEALEQGWRIGPYVSNATILFTGHSSRPLVDSNIARFAEEAFGLELPPQPHKNSQFRRLMKALTPEKTEMAWAFYLAIIDLNASDISADSI